MGGEGAPLPDPEFDADRRLLVDLAERCGMSVWAPRGDDLLEVGDLEDTRLLSRGHGLFGYDSTSRGARTRVASFGSAVDARRMMMLDLGLGYRSGKGMPSLPLKGLSPDSALEEGPTAHRLTWLGGEATFRSGWLGRSEAEEFSWIARASLTDIAASMRHLNGEPLFDLGIRYETRHIEPARPPAHLRAPDVGPPPADAVAAVADDPALDALLQELGWSRASTGPADVLAVDDGQAGRLIAYQQASYAYVSTVQPDYGKTVATFSSVHAARRFLLLDLAQILRMRRRLPALRPPVPAPACVVEQTPTGYEVRWADGSADFGPGPVRRQAATAFSWVVSATSADIAASYADPNGAPLFTRR